jgi:hypothetical protein
VKGFSKNKNKNKIANKFLTSIFFLLLMSLFGLLWVNKHPLSALSERVVFFLCPKNYFSMLIKFQKYLEKR